MNKSLLTVAVIVSFCSGCNHPSGHRVHWFVSSVVLILFQAGVGAAEKAAVGIADFASALVVVMGTAEETGA